MDETVLVYRDGGCRVNCRGELARLRRLAQETPPSSDAALSLVIQIAEFESALIDAMSPLHDGVNSTSSALRAITEDAAAGWLATVDRDSTRRPPSSIARRLTQFEAMRLPNAIELRVSEGYAYYALFPETYAASARRFARETGARRIHAIGIRSIGTSLSAIAAAALRREGCTVTTSTARPHGHPFDRVLRIDSTGVDFYRQEAERGAWFAIVDEGPGLSGSSFASVASFLRSLDIPPSRIALFPSRDPDPSVLRSEAARRIWNEHPRYCAATEDGPTPERLFAFDEPVVDFSAGRWRDTIFAARGSLAPLAPPAHPQHERVKRCAPRARRIVRFAGLGAYGEATAARAAALAELGIGVEPGELRSGFLDLPFVDGVPLARCGSAEDAAAIGRYIARVCAAFPVREPADTGSLLRAIEKNLDGLVPPLRIDLPDDIPASALDGRMLAHEWIRTERGLVKVDALDHHADHFLAGPQPAAWDLAGAEIELRMKGGQASALIDAFERESADRLSRRLLPFYRLAYAAFRYGYATMAAETLRDSDDGDRFTGAAAFYSQCALNAAAGFTASAKSPLKQIARSSTKT